MEEPLPEIGQCGVHVPWEATRGGLFLPLSRYIIYAGRAGIGSHSILLFLVVLNELYPSIDWYLSTFKNLTNSNGQSRQDFASL